MVAEGVSVLLGDAAAGLRDLPVPGHHPEDAGDLEAVRVRVRLGVEPGRAVQDRVRAEQSDQDTRLPAALGHQVPSCYLKGPGMRAARD